MTALSSQTWYRARRFLRRHGLGVATAALVLIAALVAALWFLSQQLAHQRDLAQQRANDVEQVVRFEADMLKQVDPSQVGKQLMDDMQAKYAAALLRASVPDSERTGQVATFVRQVQRVNATDTARDMIERTMLKPAIAAIDKQLASQPVVAATLRQVLADRYVEMGLYDVAMPLQQSALATRLRVLGEDSPDTLQSINAMGELLEDQGKLGEAEPYLREALERRRRVLGPEHRDTLESMTAMAELLKNQGKLSEAEPYFREALQTSRRVNGEEGKQTLALVGEIGVLLDNEGKLSESETYLREAAEKAPRVLGDGSPDALALIDALAWALLQQGKMSAAEPYARAALEKSHRYLGEDHPSTLYAVYTMGNILHDEGKLSEAEPYYREALEERRRVLGAEHADTVESILDLGGLLTDEGKLSEAEPYLHEAVETSSRVLGDKDPTTIYAIDAMGILLQEQGKLGEAEPYFRDALEKSRRAQGERGPSTEATIGHMGALLVAQHKYTDAEKLLAPFEAEARGASTGYFTSSHAMILLDLGKARTALGEFAAAEADLLEARPAFNIKRVNTNATRECTVALVDLYNTWNIADPGKGYDAKAAEWKRKLAEFDSPRPAAAVH